MLDKIVLWAGTEETKLEVRASPVTLFIGPNNSGKTLLLRELGQALIQSQNSDRTVKILVDVRYRFPDPDDVRLIFQGTGGRSIPIRTSTESRAVPDSDWYVSIRPSAFG